MCEEYGRQIGRPLARAAERAATLPRICRRERALIPGHPFAALQRLIQCFCAPEATLPRHPGALVSAELSSDVTVGRPCEPQASGWLAVAAVAVSVFVVTTTEMSPVGLLPEIADDLRISEGTAGLSVSVYGVLAGLAAPPLTIGLRRVDRRTLLLVILTVFTVGNAFTALAVGPVTFFLARFAVGLIHGLLWAIVATIAIRLVSEHRATQATAAVFSGISLALVLGVPIGSFVGGIVGWRAAFWGLSALSALCLVAATRTVPRLPALSSTTLADGSRRGLGAIRTPLVITAVVVVGNYAAYTYIVPFLRSLDGVDAGLTGPILLAYGVAGVVGNVIAGALLSRTRSPIRVLVGLTAAAAAAMATLVLVDSLTAAIALMAVWGAAYSGMPVVLQTLVLSGSRTGETLTSMYVLVFNCSIAMGALVGGMAIDSRGPSAPIVLGAIVTALGLAVVASPFARTHPRPS